MKVTILQENLSKALTTTSRFVSSKIKLPILSNILLKAYKNKLEICATNLETSISYSLGAKVDEDGELTLPGKTITEVVANLEKTQIELVKDKENLKITTESFESLLTGMNSAEFPKLPQKKDEKGLKIHGEDLKRALSRVLFSVSIDETRPVLTGVLVIVKKESLSLVATDGFRLSQKTLKIAPSGFEEKLILPKSVLTEVSRVIEDDVVFYFLKGESQVLFEGDSVVLGSRVIDGDFPPFEKILPKEGKITVSIGKEEFQRAVKIASVFARDAGGLMKLTIGKGKVVFLAESSQSGSQKQEVDAKVDGISEKEDFLIAFNCRFLEDLLAVVEDDEVVMKLSDPNAPALFLDPKDPDFLHVIMPIRLQG